MFEIRRYWPAWIVAGLLLFLAGCNSGSKSSSVPGAPAQGTGPGGDDERPITMEGTSFKISWKPKDQASDNGFDLESGVYKHSKAAAANRLKIELGGEVQLRRILGQPLVISLGLIASQYDLLQATTKKNGKHLSISAAREFDDSVDNSLIHPDTNAKIKTITVDNVTVASGSSLPAACRLNGVRVVCENPDTSTIKPKVVVCVCKGSGCEDECPTPP